MKRCDDCRHCSRSYVPSCRFAESFITPIVVVYVERPSAYSVVYECTLRRVADKWQCCLCLQDHNYTAPLPCTPPLSPLAPPSPTTKFAGSTTGLAGLPLDETGSTTALAPASGIKEVIVSTTTTGDPAVGDDSVTRCICDFQHDDGYMICCDLCGSVSSLGSSHSFV